MNLNDRINEDLKIAMKEKDNFKLGVIRMVKGAIQLLDNASCWVIISITGQYFSIKICFPSNLSRVAVNPKIYLYFTLLNTSEKQDEAYLCSSSNTKISTFQSCLITVLIISTVELNNNPHWSNCNCHCIFKLSVGTTINTFKLLYLDNTDFKHLSAVTVFDYVIVRLFILTSYYY